MIATLMACNAIREPSLSLLCRGPYEKVLQARRTRPACQTNMACRIEHELREILRTAVLAKLLGDLDPEFDIPLRMLEHVGNLRRQILPLEAIAERLRLRELLLEEALLVGQTQGPEPERAHSPVVRRLLRIRRHIDHTERFDDLLPRLRVISAGDECRTPAGKIEVVPVEAGNHARKIRNHFG